MKILIADHDGQRGVALASQLRAQDGTFSITVISKSENLLDAVRRHAPDVIIVDTARPDRDGIDSVRQLHEVQRLPVVMFVDDDDPSFMEEAIAAGVISYHVRGVAAPDIKPVLRAAMAFFRRVTEMSDRLAKAEEEIAARETIEAAKRLLMRMDGMNEPEAHKFLRRMAMDQQKKMADAAQALLAERGQRNG
jgi:response regulator NasT